MVRKTSLQAWDSVQSTLSPRQRQVLAAIHQLGKATNEGIAQHLGLPVHTVTPRTGELEAKGMIRECGRCQTSSGRSACLWQAVPKKGTQLTLF